MLTQINLDYDKVTEQTAAMSARLDAALKEVAYANQKKARTSVETQKKLLSFIANSAKSVAELDAELDHIFQSFSLQDSGRW